MFDTANAAWAAMRADPAEWAAELAEREDWDVTLSDQARPDARAGQGTDRVA
jgi:hypothetical protein